MKKQHKNKNHIEKHHLERKHKRRRIIKKGWIILGLILFLWTAFWFVEVKILHQYQYVFNVMMFTIGCSLLINYALATVVYWVIKRLKRKWEIRK